MWARAAWAALILIFIVCVIDPNEASTPEHACTIRHHQLTAERRSADAPFFISVMQISDTAELAVTTPNVNFFGRVDSEILVRKLERDAGREINQQRFCFPLEIWSWQDIASIHNKSVNPIFKNCAFQDSVVYTHYPDRDRFVGNEGADEQNVLESDPWAVSSKKLRLANSPKVVSGLSQRPSETSDKARSDGSNQSRVVIKKFKERDLKEMNQTIGIAFFFAGILSLFAYLYKNRGR